MEANNCNPVIVDQVCRSFQQSECAPDFEAGWGSNFLVENESSPSYGFINIVQEWPEQHSSLTINDKVSDHWGDVSIITNFALGGRKSAYSNFRESVGLLRQLGLVRPKMLNEANRAGFVIPVVYAKSSSEAVTVSVMAKTIQEVLGLNMAQLARIVGVSRPTLYNHLRSESAPVEKYSELYDACTRLRGEGVSNLKKGLKSILIDGKTLLDRLKARPVDYPSFLDAARSCHKILHSKDVVLSSPTKVDGSRAGLAAISKSS